MSKIALIVEHTVMYESLEEAQTARPDIDWEKMRKEAEEMRPTHFENSQYSKTHTKHGHNTKERAWLRIYN